MDYFIFVFFPISSPSIGAGPNGLWYTVFTVWIAADLFVTPFIDKFVSVYLGMYFHPGLGSMLV